ncbi:hypothetical protein GLX27_001099 [Malassezia furfur]|uniref:Protein Zds1 C-terminal domain-containing protein n=1 Tax=Malassezia furfur TaxID=55194 RepID=A0ABY8ENI9_MALFU|nr:hypothetical protein GLX27_001099 [Malassezia furfur]
MANPEITDLELQREVEALRTRRRQSVNRAVLDPDLPDLQVPGVFSESRPSLDSQASASSTASSSYPVPSTPPDTGLGAFAFDEHHFNVNPPLFGSSHRARYLARRNARAAQTADAQEKGPLPEPPTAEEAASYGAPGSGAPLLWVPAGAHPEISPADFRRFMKEQAERNVSQHETDSNIPTPRASLSPALDGASDEQGEAVVAANRLLRRNSSVARRSSSLRKQIRPDARDVSSTEAPAGPMAERARRPGSLLAVHSQLPVARDVGEADATPSAPDTREDDRGAGAATHAADNDMGHPRPLPTPGASQLQRNSRNMKLARAPGATGASRNVRAAPASPTSSVAPAPPTRAPPRKPVPAPDTMVSTIEALTLDAPPAAHAGHTGGRSGFVEEPERTAQTPSDGASTRAVPPSARTLGGDAPRRGNTLPSRLEDTLEVYHQRRAINAANVRAKASTKEALPDLPGTDGARAPKRRSSERVPVPRAVPPTPLTASSGAAPPPAPSVSTPLPAASRRSEDDTPARAGPRPLPEPKSTRAESRPLPEPKGAPLGAAIEPVVAPRAMERVEPRPVPPPPAPRPLSGEAAAPAEPLGRRRSDGARAVPPPPPRRSAEAVQAAEARRSAEAAPEPRSVETTRSDSPRSSIRDKRGFGLSWFGLSKDDDDEDKESSGKRRKNKDEVPPPPPLLPAPTLPPAPKRKEKDTFLSNLFGKRKNNDSDSLRGRARTLFSSSAASPPPAVEEYAWSRFPLHVERALYRVSHIKLANPRRALQEQVVISNMMFWYLSVINSSQSRSAEIGNHNARQTGRSEYDEAELRSCRGTPPLPEYTGVLQRAMPHILPQTYMPYGMGMLPPPTWGFPPGYPPAMYMDAHTQSWVPMPSASEPTTPTSDYDVNGYVLDGYYTTPTTPHAPVEPVQDRMRVPAPAPPPAPAPAPMPSPAPAPVPTGPSWSQAAPHTPPPRPPPPPAPVSPAAPSPSAPSAPASPAHASTPPARTAKPTWTTRANAMPMHAPGPGVHEAPGAMEKQAARAEAPASRPSSHSSSRTLRNARSTPALGPRKDPRAVPSVPRGPTALPTPPLPSLHTARSGAPERG